MLVPTINLYIEQLSTTLQKAPALFSIAISLLNPNIENIEPNNYIQQITNNSLYPSNYQSEKDIIETLYEDNNYTPLWIEDTQLKPKPAKLLKKIIINNPQYDSLSNLINEFINKSDGNNIATADIITTHLLINQLTHYKHGFLNPSLIEEYQDLKSEINYPDLLDDLQNSNFEHLTQGQKKLSQKIKYYHQIQNEYDKIKPLIIGKILKIGDTNPQIISLREKLFLLGDLEQATTNSKFDKEFKQGVISFQKRHNLKADGIIGKNFIRTINIPLSHKIETMELNFERMSWQNDSLNHQKHIYINIPEYKLYLKDGEKIIYDAKIIIGKKDRKTPIFNDKMSYIVFNPVWNIPYKLFIEDFITKFKNRPDFTLTSGIKIVSNFGEIPATHIDWNNFHPQKNQYRFIQTAGPSNSLGKIKFMFPNKYSIYIHDTPSKHLFDKKNRAFSSGCIRLEKPIELANIILEKYSIETIDRMIRTKREQHINLKSKFPVSINYLTSWVDENNLLNFRYDIYGYDKNLSEQLKLAKIDNLKKLKEIIAYQLLQIKIHKIKSEMNKHLGILSPFELIK